MQPWCSAQSAVNAEAPQTQKLMACKKLAQERGYKFGAFNKGAIKPKDFVRGPAARRFY